MKLPSFQFYPGDWMKDFNLRRCSPAARGLWMDVLCLMFDSPWRGKLVTERCDKGVTTIVTLTLRDCAEALQGDLRSNMRLLEELVSKGVMKQEQSGIYYSKRLVSDEHQRELDRKRQQKKRDESRESHANVTQPVTRESQHSSSSPSGIKRTLSIANSETLPDDSDLQVERIIRKHPRFEAPEETRKAFVLEAVPEVQRSKNCTTQQAIEFLEQKTEEFASWYALWSEDDQKHCRASPRWYAAACYWEKPEMWEQKAKLARSADGQSKQQKRVNGTIANATAGAAIAAAIATGGISKPSRRNENIPSANTPQSSKTVARAASGDNAPQIRNATGGNASDGGQPEIIPPRKSTESI